jgi:hypothetical protein
MTLLQQYLDLALQAEPELDLLRSDKLHYSDILWDECSRRRLRRHPQAIDDGIGAVNDLSAEDIHAHTRAVARLQAERRG